MGFSLWHWLIVIAVSAFAFRHQLSSLILYLTDPGRALRDRLGMLNANDREAMVRKQERIRVGLKQKLWLIVAAAAVLIFAWKAASYGTGRTRADSFAATGTGNAANDRILALSAVEQAAALGKLISERCAGAGAFYQGMVKGQAFWSVRCSSGEAFQIAINPDAAGTTRVLVCGNAAPLATDCFKKL